MKIRLFIILLFPIFLLTSAAAQNGLFGIGYNTALPMGETSDFIDAYSWRGVSLEARWLKSSDVSAGFFAGWNVFHEKETGDFFDPDDTKAFSGTRMRTINAFLTPPSKKKAGKCASCSKGLFRLLRTHYEMQAKPIPMSLWLPGASQRRGPGHNPNYKP